MSTFLWIPEEHPEEQYTDVHEQAKVGAALGGLIVVTVVLA